MLNEVHDCLNNLFYFIAPRLTNYNTNKYEKVSSIL